MKRREAMLALEDGRVFRGLGFGAETETTGEVVFNTAMTGYQEVLSDPSYCGQILTFTYPLIGNYGVNDQDFESAGLRAQGMVCRDLCEVPSNWRSTGTLDGLLRDKGLPGISDVDTRALTRHLRDRGTMRGCLSTVSVNADELIEKARKSPRMEGLALADVVTCVEPYWWGENGMTSTEPAADRDKPLVVVPDFGVKWNILRCLRAEGFRVRVVPALVGAAMGRAELRLNSANPTVASASADFLAAAAGAPAGVRLRAERVRTAGDGADGPAPGPARRCRRRRPAPDGCRGCPAPA